ncbi:MAG: hypothetical protein K9N23_13870 [Akkermansiaceae bacterium]|nr:hypothetical protein [Akkermansiaceae bacterium]
MSDERPRPLLLRILLRLGSCLSWLVLLVAALWAFGALWFDLPKPLMPPIIAAIFGFGVLLAAILVRPRWRAKLGIAIAILLVNGYGDEMLYERGSIDRSLPFAELKKLSPINLRAKAADQDPDFSRKIRAGLPGMPPGS